MTEPASRQKGTYPDWSSVEPLHKGSAPGGMDGDEEVSPFGPRPTGPACPEPAAPKPVPPRPPVPQYQPNIVERLFSLLRGGTPPFRRPLPILFRVWQAQALFIVFGTAIFCYYLYTSDKTILVESALATMLVLGGVIPALIVIELMQRYSALLAIGVSMLSGGLLAYAGERSLGLSPDVLAKLLAASVMVLGSLSLLALILTRLRARFSVPLARQLTCLYCLPLSAALFLLWQKDKTTLLSFLEQNRWTWTHLTAQSPEVYSSWFSAPPQVFFLCLVAGMVLQFLFYTYLSLSKDRLSEYFAG